ncbi:hypothetical protein JCM6882_006502 [Rhodosporidiobolus microsporus]
MASSESARVREVEDNLVHELDRINDEEPLKEWNADKVGIASKYMELQPLIYHEHEATSMKAEDELEGLVEEMEELRRNETHFRLSQAMGQELTRLEAEKVLRNLERFQQYFSRYRDLTSRIRDFYLRALNQQTEKSLKDRCALEYQILRHYPGEGKIISDLVRKVAAQCTFLHKNKQPLPPSARDFMDNKPLSSAGPSSSPNFVQTRPAMQPPPPPTGRPRARRRSSLGQYVDYAEQHSLGSSAAGRHLSARKRAIYAAAAAGSAGRGW